MFVFPLSLKTRWLHSTWTSDTLKTQQLLKTTDFAQQSSHFTPNIAKKHWKSNLLSITKLMQAEWQDTDHNSFPHCSLYKLSPLSVADIYFKCQQTPPASQLVHWPAEKSNKTGTFTDSVLSQQPVFSDCPRLTQLCVQGSPTLCAQEYVSNIGPTSNTLCQLSTHQTSLFFCNQRWKL